MSDEKVQKFVKMDEISSLLNTCIQKENDYRSSRCPSSVFDPSHITECTRRIIYRANGVNQEKNPSYLLMQDELFSRKKWFEYFEKSRFVKVIDKNIITADCHYNISGNADIILKIIDSIYVVKIQPLSCEDFARVQKEGAFKRHVIETMIYVWLLEIHDGLLLYENKNTNDYVVFHVQEYAPIIKSVMKKCTELMENKIQGTIPSRPYKTKESVECCKCEFNQQCW